MWDKIIIRRRSGVCCGLHGLFARLFKQIGFDVRYLYARDHHEADDTFGDEPIVTKNGRRTNHKVKKKKGALPFLKSILRS